MYYCNMQETSSTSLDTCLPGIHVTDPDNDVLTMTLAGPQGQHFRYLHDPQGQDKLTFAGNYDVDDPNLL